MTLLPLKQAKGRPNRTFPNCHYTPQAFLLQIKANSLTVRSHGEIVSTRQELLRGPRRAPVGSELSISVTGFKQIE